MGYSSLDIEIRFFEVSFVMYFVPERIERSVLAYHFSFRAIQQSDRDFLDLDFQ